VFGFPGIDALQDAQPPEVVQGELKLPKRSPPTNVLRGLTGFVLEVVKNIDIQQVPTHITLKGLVNTLKPSKLTFFGRLIMPVYENSFFVKRNLPLTDLFKIKHAVHQNTRFLCCWARGKELVYCPGFGK